MAATLVQQSSARKVFNGGPKQHTYAGATTAGNLLVAVVAMEPDALGPPSFTTPPGWTFDGDVAGFAGGTPTNRSRFYLYRKTADGTETFVTFDGWAAGTPGIIYIAEYASAAVGAATLTTGTFPSDALSAAHTAIVDEVALHIFFDASFANTFTWDTSGLAADNGSAMTQHDLPRVGGSPQTVLTVKPTTYSVAGAKSGLPLVPSGYGSFIAVATLAFGALPVPVDEDAPITVDLRLVKVRETDPPYQVPA